MPLTIGGVCYLEFTSKDGALVKVTTHTDAAAFDDLRAEWNTLLDRSKTGSIFSTWEWQSNWWAAYHPGDLWIIAVRDDAGTLIGLAPWFIETRTDERIVRGVGCVDVSDYVDVIVDSAHFAPVLEAFARCLQENRASYDRINLCNLPEESPMLKQFPDVLQSCGFTAEREFQEVCPLIELPDTWDAFLEQRLNKKDRHEMRRKIRRAQGREGVDFYTVGAEHDFDAELETFLHLMAASAPYKAEFLQDPQHMAFFKRVMPVMFAGGWLRLHFMTVQGKAIAAYLNFNYHDRVMVYNSGLDHEYDELSPGIVLIAHTIREAIEQGAAVFDFLRGNERYKYHVGGQDTNIYMLKAR